jgi:inorganic pyrophosphatase
MKKFFLPGMHKLNYAIYKGKSFCTKFYTRSNDMKGSDYRVFLYKDKENIHKASFWHDIPPLNCDGSLNMVVEIPKGEMAKLEMSKETHNPIKQDIKKNKILKSSYLRFYKLAPDFNYGFLPRTWENNKVKTMGNYVGDDDPLDLVEVSGKRLYTGQILNVEILGSFCLIDQDEVDWKILVIDSGSKTNDKNFAEKYMNNNSEKIKSIMNWFKIYKIFEGKKENIIYGNDKIFNTKETLHIIEENRKFYDELISTANI